MWIFILHVVSNYISEFLQAVVHLKKNHRICRYRYIHTFHPLSPQHTLCLLQIWICGCISPVLHCVMLVKAMILDKNRLEASLCKPSYLTTLGEGLTGVMTVITGITRQQLSQHWKHQAC